MKGLKIAGVILAIIAVTVFQGWGCSVLWNWFLAPVVGVEIGTAHAVGLSMLLKAFGLSEEQNDDGPIWHDVVVTVLVTLSCLAVGWVARRFM